MEQATLNSEFIAAVAGYVTVFNYNGDIREYLSSSVEYLAVGVGIPANSCTDAPGEARENFAICRTTALDGWEYVTDHRGETVYDTETGQPVVITVLGDYPADMTTAAPLTPYDQWNGSEWVTDVAAQRTDQVQEAEQRKAALLSEVKDAISVWQTELQLGIISDEDKASLTTQLMYIKALQSVDTATAPNLIWPEPPGK